MKRKLLPALLVPLLIGLACMSPSTATADFSDFVKKTKEDFKKEFKKGKQPKKQEPKAKPAAKPAAKSADKSADKSAAGKRPSAKQKTPAKTTPRTSNAKVAVTPLFKLGQTLGDRFIVSPDGRKVAYRTSEGSRAAIGINGKNGPPFDKVDFYYDANGETFFSPNSQHFSYIAVRGGTKWLVVDHKPVVELGPDNLVPGQLEFQFSPDGKRYAALVGGFAGGVNGNVLYLDGKRVPTPGYKVIRALRFSADGKHFAFIATTELGLGQSDLFLDGKQVTRAPKGETSKVSGFVLSDRGGQLAYVYTRVKTRIANGRRHMKHTVTIVCGKTRRTEKSPEVGDSGWGWVNSTEGAQFTLSADGKRCAYVAPPVGSRAGSYAPGGGRVLVSVHVDGRKEGPYEAVEPVVFADTGNRYGYTAKRKGGYVMVVNGKPLGLEYSGLQDFQLSPGAGKHAFAIAHHNTGTFLIRDGKEQGPFGQISMLTLSDDGEHYGFVASARAAGAELWLDGKKVEGVGTIKWLQYFGKSPSYKFGEKAHSNGDRIYFRNKTTSGATVELPLVSADGEHIAYKVQRNNRGITIHWMVDNTMLPENPGQYSGALSPDGKHVAAAGIVERTGEIVKRAHAWQVFLDGAPVGPVMDVGSGPQLARGSGQKDALMFNEAGELHVVGELDGTLIKLTILP